MQATRLCVKKSNRQYHRRLKNLNYKPDTSNKLLNDQEPSINNDEQINYPSTENETTVEKEDQLTLNEQESPINEPENNKQPSIIENSTVKKETGLNVNTDKNEIIKPDIKAVNTDTKAKNEKPETYIEYESPFINELAEQIEDRDNIGKLSVLLYNSTETSAYWISLRYKCLVECLLTFSEMQNIDLNDLKEVCNAFTLIIQSRSFAYLPIRYPYTNDIQQLRDTLKNLCINADQDEPFTLRFKTETQI